MEYALESDIEAQLRIASALLWFWHIRGHRNEGIEWLERGLSIEAAERGDQALYPGRALIRGKALIASGTNALMFFDYGKASLHLQESLPLFQALGKAGKQGSAYALLRLGLLPSNGDKMKDIIEQSLALFRETGDKFGMAECLTQLAANALKDDNYEQAAAFVEEQLTLSRELGDQDGIATALWNMGDLAFFGQGDYRRATALIEESLSLFRSVDNKWAQGLVYSELGDIFFWQGDYEQAMKIYKDSMALAQKIGDGFLIKFSLYNQGFIAWLQGDYINAVQKITDSMIEFRNIGYDWLTGSSMHALGDIALAQGNDKHAAQWYENELAFGKEIEMYATQAFASCGLGKVAWIQDNYSLAAQRFEEGLRMSQEADFKYGELHTLYGLGRVALSMGNYSTAHSYFEKMLEMQKLRLSPLYRWNWLKTYGYAIAYPFDGFAIVAAMQDQIQRATRLLSVAESLYIPLRFEMSVKERAEHDQAIASARAALGEEAFAAAWEEGKKMTLDEAIAYALKED